MKIGRILCGWIFLLALFAGNAFGGDEGSPANNYNTYYGYNAGKSISTGLGTRWTSSRCSPRSCRNSRKSLPLSLKKWPCMNSCSQPRGI